MNEVTPMTEIHNDATPDLVAYVGENPRGFHVAIWSRGPLGMTDPVRLAQTERIKTMANARSKEKAIEKGVKLLADAARTRAKRDRAVR